MFSLDPRGGHNRYKFKIDFFEKWTPKMAYILGFLYADGDIEDVRRSSRTQYITFASIDKEILEVIKNAMGSEHNINYRAPRKVTYSNGKTYESSGIYRLRIGSKKMFDDLIKLGLTPRKSLTIIFPNNIPDNCFRHFIRGYFDGDGCVTIKKGKGKYGQPILKGIAVIFTSGSKLFLEGLRDNACRFANFGKRSVYYGSNAYYLKYDTFESLKWFKFFYGGNLSELFLERKFNVFKKYFQIRPIRIDGETANILKK
ncbi:MAG: LAGLIDADG family homing endonuclease [Patescibacteria group bacterium]